MAIFDRQTLEFVRRFAKAYPRRTLLMVVLLVLSGFAEGIGIAALLPVISAGIGEGAGGSSGRSGITATMVGLLEVLHVPTSVASLLALAVFAIFLKGCFRWLAMRQVGFSVAKIGRDLRERLVDALMAVRWSYFTSQPTGYFSNAISTEARRASSAYRNACAALAGLIQIPVYAGLIVAVSWKVALASVFLGAFGAAVLGSFVGLSRRAGGDQTTRMKSLLAQLTEALGSVKPIKAMGREEKFSDLVTADIHALEAAEKRQVTAAETLRSFHEPVLMAIIALGLWGAVVWGDIAFTDVLIVAFLFHRLAGRFTFVQLEYETLAAGQSAFWSFEELVAEAASMREPIRGRLQAPKIFECIDFKSVTFAYASTPVLQAVSFSVPAGSFVAIVGPSGSGKTTIIDLVSGLYAPDEGQITIDGTSLNEIDVHEWRRQIGYVPQETVLFHDTILRNVWFGQGEPDVERVQRALEQAEAWSFVASLPDGVQTVVGERGSKLSGGQRQRIAIARALVSNPRLLMLDEATTALDPQTEASILETLGRLRGDVTVLAISHQQALRAVADIVYELQHGHIERIQGGPDLHRKSVNAGGR